LHGGTKMNCKQWLSKGLNNKQWQTMLANMEGPILFTGQVGSLTQEVW
jgi:hypothetical protein